MPKGKGQKTIVSVMRDFKKGGLHSGSNEGPLVTNPKQAIAIALSESKKRPRKKK